jgi:pentatricopeptide repeat protein
MSDQRRFDQKPRGNGQKPPFQKERPNRSQPPPTPKSRPERVELPVSSSEPEPTPSEITYIAYAEKGDDVAFEMSKDLEEALGIFQIMKEDGFSPRLYQAVEMQIVVEAE